MEQKRLPTEGAVFLVPLPKGGFSVGVLIRTTGKGRAYGAFFGPRVTNASDVNISRFRYEDASLRCRFGDYGLHTLRWPLIGSIPNWSSHRWGLPRFARRHDNPEICYVTEYDDNLIARKEALRPIEEAANHPEDAQFGSGIVEIKLEKILA